MSHTLNRIILAVLVTGFCFVPCAESVVSQEQDGEFWTMIQTVQDILSGKNLDQANRAISPGASLVCGSRLENLRSIVAGEIATCSLVDTSYHGIAVQGRTNQSEDMGFIVLKTVQSDTTKVRYHSVVFLKDSVGHFKIILWHSGNQGR